MQNGVSSKRKSVYHHHAALSDSEVLPPAHNSKRMLPTGMAPMHLALMLCLPDTGALLVLITALHIPIGGRLPTARTMRGSGTWIKMNRMYTAAILPMRI